MYVINEYKNAQKHEKQTATSLEKTMTCRYWI